MFNVMSKAASPHFSPSVELNTIWIVEADETYNIEKTANTPTNPYVAIRTTEGNGVITIKDVGDLNLTQNSLVIFNYSKVKKYFCEGSKWCFFWFEFNADPIMLPKLNNVHNIEISKKEISLFHECFDALGSPTPFSARKASCKFSTILVSWISSLSIKENTHSISIEKVLKYITQHPSSNISISKLSKIAEMSERLFRDVIKEYTQKSPKKYIEDIRLNAAKELIVNTNMQIKTIALSLGFSNQYYFSRVFSKAFGLSPRNFRNDFLSKLK